MDESTPLHDIIAEGKRIIAECKESSGEIERMHREYLRHRAGPFLDEMMRSRIAAEACLTNDSSLVRGVAIEILFDVWDARDKVFTEQCRDMVQNDTDTEVRGLAALQLGKLYEGTNDSEAGHLLAAMVADASLQADLRQSAYFALLNVCGLFSLRPEILLRFQFPDNVDWSVVSQFR